MPDKLHLAQFGLIQRNCKSLQYICQEIRIDVESLHNQLSAGDLYLIGSPHRCPSAQLDTHVRPTIEQLVRMKRFQNSKTNSHLILFLRAPHNALHHELPSTHRVCLSRSPTHAVQYSPCDVLLRSLADVFRYGPKHWDFHESTSLVLPIAKKEQVRQRYARHLSTS